MEHCDPSSTEPYDDFTAYTPDIWNQYSNGHIIQRSNTSIGEENVNLSDFQLFDRALASRGSPSFKELFENSLPILNGLPTPSTLPFHIPYTPPFSVGPQLPLPAAPSSIELYRQGNSSTARIPWFESPNHWPPQHTWETGIASIFPDTALVTPPWYGVSQSWDLDLSLFSHPEDGPAIVSATPNHGVPSWSKTLNDDVLADFHSSNGGPALDILNPDLPDSIMSRSSEEHIFSEWDFLSGDHSSSSRPHSSSPWEILSGQSSNLNLARHDTSELPSSLEQIHIFKATEPSNTDLVVEEEGTIAPAKSTGTNVRGNSGQHRRDVSITDARRHQSKGRVSKRKGPLKESARVRAAAMRNLGTCVRCHIYRVGCDESNPCKRCQKSLQHPRSFHQPCWRMDIRTIALVRHSNGRFAQNEVAFIRYNWDDADASLRILDLTWYLPGAKSITSRTLSVPFRTYVPDGYSSTNTTDSYWQSHGVERCIKLPPYAGYDDGLLLSDVKTFLQESQPEVEAWIWSRYRDDDITHITYAEAKRYAKMHKSSLIDAAFRMQCGAIMSQGWGSVTSKGLSELYTVDYDLIGGAAYGSYDAYNRGKDRPIPQAVQHQMDVAILKCINKEQTQLLKDLDRSLGQKHPKPWYEIFLTFFILITNLEYIYEGALGYMLACMKTILEVEVRAVIKKQVEEYALAAKVMIYYFRCVLKGPLPFKLARQNMAKLQKDGRLDDEAAGYIRRLLPLLDEQNIDFYSTEEAIMKDFEQPPNGRWIRELFRALDNSGLHQ